MAQRNNTGRSGAATAMKSRSGSRAAIKESDIALRTATDIRNELKKRGVGGISALRKPDLVKALALTLRAENRRGTAAGARKSTAAATARAKPAGAKRPAGAARGVAGASRATAARRGTGVATTRKTAGTAARRGGAGAAAAGNPTATRKATGTATRKATGGAGGAGGAAPATVGAGGVREGSAMSRSLRYAQRIASPADRPERPGRSLVTTHHDVIRQWARDRNASPATISGTEREGRAGVLTFNFPGWREGGRIREISWEEWLRTFDVRRLNFIYQEQTTDGRQSNFFRTESPDRESA